MSKEACDQITTLVSSLADQAGLPFSQLAKLWYESVAGKASSGRRHWNAYQAYIRHPEYGGEERARLRDPEGRVPLASQLSAPQIVECYKLFKQSKTQWAQILETFHQMSAPKGKRHCKTFDQGAAQVKELLGRLQRDGIDGAVVLASGTRNYAYETQLATGFFDARCRANKELMGLHLQAHRTNELSLKSVVLAFEEPVVPQVTVSAEADGSDAMAMAASTTNGVSLTNLLRSAYLEDVPTVKIGKNKFPWLKLREHLAENGLYIHGYPVGVRYPHDVKGIQGVHGLSTLEKTRLRYALRLRDGSAGDRSKGLRFERYDGNKNDLSNSKIPVIFSTSYGKDDLGKVLKTMYFNFDIDLLSESRTGHRLQSGARDVLVADPGVEDGYYI
ncbi:hypothetical protein DFH06DRAFT_1139698 [Mycena polygramma]|nr:hypothetical protein DFH06DRAFT_1139698 [Mycena polygramma]